MDFLELARECHSVWRFAGKEVEREKLNAVLEAGGLAPTACNYQPQRVPALDSEAALGLDAHLGGTLRSAKGALGLHPTGERDPGRHPADGLPPRDERPQPEARRAPAPGEDNAPQRLLIPPMPSAPSPHHGGGGRSVKGQWAHSLSAVTGTTNTPSGRR